tara:strand:- start:73 stop:342 length:270 start_codon:yes stop_codon:yes gene_type:complete
MDQSNQILGYSGISGVIIIIAYLIYKLLDHHKVSISSGCCKFNIGSESPEAERPHRFWRRKTNTPPEPTTTKIDIISPSPNSETALIIK